MIANFDCLKQDAQNLLLRAPLDTLTRLQASLSKYIVFSKATLTDTTSDYQCIGLRGDHAEDWLAQLTGIKFEDGQTLAQRDEGIFIKLDAQRIECWLSDSQLATTLTNDTPKGTLQEWQVIDIELGRGWVQAATSEEFLPQLLNLQTSAINGINFKKGCYTGQEIVARMHYKGKLKKHMFRFRAHAAQEVEPGAELVCDAKTQAIGTVVNAVTIGDQIDLLAITSDDNAYVDGLRLSANTDGKLELQTLPYAITNEP